MKKKKKFDDNADFFTIIEDEKPSSGITAPHTLTPEEVLSSSKPKSGPKSYNSHRALDLLKKRMAGAIDSVKEQSNITEKFKEETKSAAPVEEPTAQTKTKPETTDIKPEAPETKPETTDIVSDSKKSLLDKCRPYLIEDDGTKTDLNSKPLYKLQSVAEILKSNSEKAMERLTEKYDISFDDLGNTANSYKTEIPQAEEKKEPLKAEKVVPAAEEKKDEKKEATSGGFVSSFEDKLVISDIDTPSALADKPKNEFIHNTATVTFTPIDDGSGQRKLNVSTKTRSINLTGEFANLPSSSEEANSDEVKLQENEFEEFVPDEEITTDKDGNRLLRKQLLKKRRSFIAATLSVFVTILLCLNWIPPIKRAIIANTAAWMIGFSVLALIPVLLNLDCFKGLKKIFSQDSLPDISASLSVITVAAYAVFGILNKESVVEMLIFLSTCLSFRAIGEFMKSSYMVINLKIANSRSQKETLKLINDSAITFTLAENSVDGDALVAATQPSSEISDFMKYSTHGSFLNGKLPFITGASIILSIITGIVCAFYFDSVTDGFYAAAVIQCLTALPAAFLIDNLPLYRAAAKLGKSGAMILGKTGADFVEMANAAVITADKLFPAGSVTLHQMQALSSNNLEDTIVRAASLTECLGSTLAPIFKTIAGTGNITTLPDSDTVKYEDRMGISGWVDDRLLFIGNRTLLEAHGITVPSLEVDRKILRQGYFPVYVATEDKACALIVIQYNVDQQIAKELRELTDSGVDLLVSSCDPNLTEAMICDYFGLYEDSVKVLTAAGRHTARNVTAAAKTVSAPAICGKSSVGIASVMNCASAIKKSNMLLMLSYIIAAILGAVIFAYSSFAGSGTLLSAGTVLLYLASTTLISYLLYLIKKP